MGTQTDLLFQGEGDAGWGDWTVLQSSHSWTPHLDPNNTSRTLPWLLNPLLQSVFLER